MKRVHPSDRDLERFVEGDLEIDAAVRVALHIDSCTACANRVVLIDPLSVAFASVDDPTVPADLAAGALERVDRTDLAPPAPVVAAALFMAAAVLSLVAGGPEMLAHGAAAARALGAALGAWSSHTTALGSLWMVTAGMLFAASVVAVRSLDARKLP